MIIIGITGKKLSGKDTLCQYIREYSGPERAVRVAFADALKEEIATALGVSVQYINDNKDFFRPVLQWWGTFKREMIDKDYWVRKALAKCLPLQNNQTVIISDVRYMNEAETIKRVGGFLVRIVSDRSPADEHMSEIEMDEYPHSQLDFTVDNNGTLDELRDKSKHILKQIHNAIHTK